MRRRDRPGMGMGSSLWVELHPGSMDSSVDSLESNVFIVFIHSLTSYDTQINPEFEAKDNRPQWLKGLQV